MRWESAKTIGLTALTVIKASRTTIAEMRSAMVSFNHNPKREATEFVSRNKP